MIKITGLEKLSRDLEEASAALKSLEGGLGSVSFDPNDPASIERAIQDVNAMVDGKLDQYRRNSVIGGLAEDMKVSYRESILEEAAKARLQGDQEE